MDCSPRRARRPWRSSAAASAARPRRLHGQLAPLNLPLQVRADGRNTQGGLGLVAEGRILVIRRAAQPGNHVTKRIQRHDCEHSRVRVCLRRLGTGFSEPSPLAGEGRVRGSWNGFPPPHPNPLPPGERGSEAKAPDLTRRPVGTRDGRAAGPTRGLDRLGNVGTRQPRLPAAVLVRDQLTSQPRRPNRRRRRRARRSSSQSQSFPNRSHTGMTSTRVARPLPGAPCPAGRPFRRHYRVWHWRRSRKMHGQGRPAGFGDRIPHSRVYETGSERAFCAASGWPGQKGRAAAHAPESPGRAYVFSVSEGWFSGLFCVVAAVSAAPKTIQTGAAETAAATQKGLTSGGRTLERLTMAWDIALESPTRQRVHFGGPQRECTRWHIGLAGRMSNAIVNRSKHVRMMTREDGGRGPLTRLRGCTRTV